MVLDRKLRRHSAAYRRHEVNGRSFARDESGYERPGVCPAFAYGGKVAVGGTFRRHFDSLRYFRECLLTRGRDADGGIKKRAHEVGSGSKAVLTAPKRDFRSPPNNGHR
jgi:hypothetical protein